MKTGERAIALLVVAAVGWYFYTRSKGLTITGEYSNPMLPAGPAATSQSLVTPSTSVGTSLTNVFSGVSHVLQSFVGRLSSRPGNAPLVPAPSRTIDPSDVSSWGLQVPPNEPAPYVSNETPAPDPSLDASAPFWSVPSTTIAAMPWTLDPHVLGFDPSYIPPPPGSR